MRYDRNLLMGGAAVLVIGSLGGFAVARMFDPHGSQVSTAGAEAEHEDEHAEEAEGFVPLKPADAEAAGVELAKVERGGGSDLLLPGRVAIAPNSQSTIGAPLAGTVMDTLVATGASVKKGAAIATIRSPAGAVVRAASDSAAAAAAAAEAVDARDRTLFDQGVIARQEWEATHAATLKAQADLRAAQAQLIALGSPNSSGIATVRSPIAGVVTHVPIGPGGVVAEGAEIAEVSDASKVELVLEAPPSSLRLITVGAQMEARWTGGQAIEAVVVGVAPASTGGSAVVRARIAGAAPPPGTVVSARMVGGVGDALTVPSEAVQTVEGQTSVFVSEPEGFRVRAVVIGRNASGRTEIISGLDGGEQIAGAGAFLLKAELAKGEAEHGH
ncbi:MAG: efflux RND transporter periplasmic adaptor subunit [Alphaproteobacteria bacterium]|nr:MAG: efflux RND transporter periplasmic adaptor subunit [Alphaproteobacteria bacterium]